MTDREDVFVFAVKVASRGAGWIVRVGTNATPAGEVRLMMPGSRIRQAWLCDARERDLRELRVDGGVVVPLPGALASVRMIPEE
jgi:hypothetical protein